MKVRKKFSGILAFFLVFTMVLSLGNVVLAARIDSDLTSFIVKIDRDDEIDLGTAVEGGRIVYSTKLGTPNDSFGPNVIDAATLKRNKVTTIAFTMTEGKKELESLGYTVKGEVPEQTAIDQVPAEPGPHVSGTTTKPGIVNFTGTMVYDLGGKLILPMQIKVLPKFFLTKDFQVPEGTSNPAMDFTFEFTPKAGTDAPKLDDVKISYKQGQKGILSSEDLTEVIKDKFTATGVYTYILKEKPSAYALHKGADYDEALSQSKAEYEVTFVVESEPGKAATGYRVLEVKAKALKDGKGQDLNGEKVENYYKEGEENGIRFDNKYNKNIKSDPKGPLKSRGLHLSKVVAGNLGDKGVYFPFTATLTKPATLTETNETAKVAKAYIYDQRTNKKVVDLTANGIANATDGVFDVTYGTEFAFNLKHGQHLVFEEVIAGSKIKANEVDAKGHTKTVASISGGKTPTTEEEILVSDAGVNEVKYTNTKEHTSAETGLFTNNSSFVALMAVAGISILGIAISSKRRKNRG